MSLPAPDFLRPVRGIPLLAYAFVAATCCAFAVAASDAWTAWAARTEAQADVQRLQRAERPRNLPPARDEAGLAPVRLLLDAPWEQRLAAIESVAAPGVAWLSIDLAHTGELQLTGLAPDGASALQLADRLRGTGAWTSVVVSRIEPTPERQQRFELRGTAAETSR